MFFISLTLALLLVFWATHTVRKSGKFDQALFVSGVGVFLSVPCLISLPALSLGSALIALVSIGCWLLGWGHKAFWRESLAAVVVSHFLVGIAVVPTIRERAKLREQYPTESLEERLAYERRSARPGDETTQDPKERTTLVGPPKKPLDSDLKELDELVREKASLRARNLGMLHESAVADFIESPGFGVTRMRWPGPQKQYIELPEAEPIPLPSPRQEPPNSVAQNETSPGEAVLGLPDPDSLRKMHRAGLVDFVNPEGFGYVQDRRHVRGFQAHQFRTMPELTKASKDTQRWQVRSIELVSLLKHDEPVAYLSRNLPRMDQLRDAKTRPLDSFEKTALGDLQRGDNLRVEFGTPRLRMLGAVRAVRQCLSCHDVERGDLLGAFSYTLLRDLPVP